MGVVEVIIRAVFVVLVVVLGVGSSVLVDRTRFWREP